MGGTDGVFAPMLKHLLESMMDGNLIATWLRASHLEKVIAEMARQKRP
jgi:hypothetical protein